MVNLRSLLLLLLVAGGCAGEVVLDLPDPLIPGAVMEGAVRITDPPSSVRSVELPQVAGLEWRTDVVQQRFANVNGRQSAETTVGLLLRAGTRGQLQLPAVTVLLADGTTMTSEPRVLRVADGDARLTGDALVEAAFEPASIVPGQPTKLVCRIRLRRGERNGLGIAPPEGAIVLGEPTAVKSRTFDAQGRPWEVETVTWPMTHATPGSYTVRGQQEYHVLVGRDFFSQRVQRHQAAIAPATLTVEPMPLAGRPAGFTGLIGPLALAAELDRERIATGEGAVLSLTVSGWQTDLVKRPAMQVAGAQFYPKDDRTADGKRVFTWDVVPTAAGTVAIPMVSLPYFDPGSRSYRSADSQPLSLLVTPGRQRDLGVVGRSLPIAVPAGPAPPPPGLPAPLRGGAPPQPPPWSAAAALSAGAVGGLLLLAVQRLAGRRRGPHRGRALRAAAGDPIALAGAVQALLPALDTPARRAAAAALQAALERHRFGGEALPDLEPWLRELEAVP